MLFIPLLLLVGCKKDITTLNNDTKRPTMVPAGSLFTYATKSYSDVITDPSININFLRFTVSQWASVTYQDEAQYNFTSRGVPNQWWSTMYNSVLQNLKQASIIINDDALMVAGEKTNKLAILDIMQVLAYSTLVNTFGNVPYTQALNPDNLFPKYDDAKTISLDLIKRLNNDINKLNVASVGFSENEDLICNGDISKWIKFANTLRMQQGLILADVDDLSAKTAFEASDSKSIASATDNLALVYKAGAPSQNPLYVEIVTGNRGDFVAANDLLNKLVSLSDPRLSLYFTPNDAGDYKGGIVGASNTPSEISKPNPNLYAANAETLFMDYVETEFYRAEAAERNYTVTGTAASHYNNAITASILYWGGTAADAATYLTRPDVAYATAAGTWKEKIGTQKWIALYNRPFNGWTELRRFDYPKITAPKSAKSGFPNRFTYPSNEQQLNGSNYTSAASAIGGDKVETKLFWDKF